MAITPWQAGGILNPQEYFGREEYGTLGPAPTTPTLLDSGIFGQTGSTTTGGCQWGYHKNAAGQCVPDTQSCPTGQTRNAAGQCVTETRCADGSLPPCDTTTRCADGSLPPCDTTTRCADGSLPPCGDNTCPNPNHVRNAAGVCGPKPGTGTDSDCPALWSRDKWGVCRPPEKEDVTTLCPDGQIWAGGTCWCPDGSPPPCGGGDPCPDPNTHWDAFSGRCLQTDVKEDEPWGGCLWGRNPHTDQCNPNPNTSLTTADIGNVRTTLGGGILTDTGLNTGDYRLDYSPYGAEDRGQDYVAPSSIWDFPDVTDAQVAVSTAIVKSNRANDAADRADDAAQKSQDKADDQRDIADKSKASDDNKAAAAAQSRADSAKVAAAEASRAAQAAAEEADRQRAAQQRADADASARKAMADHMEWMASQAEQNRIDEERRAKKYAGGTNGGLLWT